MHKHERTQCSLPPSPSSGSVFIAVLINNSTPVTGGETREERAMDESRWTHWAECVMLQAKANPCMCIFVAVSSFGLRHCLRLPVFVLLIVGMCTLVLTRGKVELSHICWPKERRQPQFTGSHPVEEAPGYRLMVTDRNMLQQSGSSLSGYGCSVGLNVFSWCSEWEFWGLLWVQCGISTFFFIYAYFFLNWKLKMTWNGFSVVSINRYDI